MSDKLPRDQSLAARVSHRMRHENSGVYMEELKQIKAALSPEQLDRIHAKQQWEQCSFLGVLRDWPSLFEPEESHA